MYKEAAAWVSIWSVLKPRIRGKNLALYTRSFQCFHVSSVLRGLYFNREYLLSKHFILINQKLYFTGGHAVIDSYLNSNL